jgi:hypothetical protein
MYWLRLIAAALVAAAATATLAAEPPYTDRFIEVNGLRLHYLDWGNRDKPAFIMLHGIGRDAHSFDHIAPRFVSEYHVLAFDLRGHGDSAWDPAGAYLVEDFVGDLERVFANRAFHFSMATMSEESGYYFCTVECFVRLPIS